MRATTLFLSNNQYLATPLVGWLNGQETGPRDYVVVAEWEDVNCDESSVADELIIDADGFEWAWLMLMLRRAKSNGRTITLVGLDTSDARRIEALDEGASAFITGDADPEDLLTALLSSRDGKGEAAEALDHLVAETPTALTARQLAAAKLYAEGWSEKECAAHLYVGVQTFRSHVRGAKNRFSTDGYSAKTRIDMQRALRSREALIPKPLVTVHTIF